MAKTQSELDTVMEGEVVSTASTHVSLARQAQEELNAVAPGSLTAAAQGKPVQATDLFPDDKWAEAPQLGDEVIATMVGNGTPFYVLSAALRPSQYGQVWRMIVDLEGKGQAFSTVFGADQHLRNERIAKIAYLIASGAPYVGPFKFAVIDTGKASPFRTLVATTVDQGKPDADLRKK